MLRLISCFSLLILIPLYASAQIIPQEGSILNYRLIGFSFPAEKRVLNYAVEIAPGNYLSEDSFKTNIINTQRGETNKIIAEVPSFGRQYTWRIVYTFGKSSKTISGLFHFSTGTVPEVDTSMARLRIITQAAKYNDAYVFLDDVKTLYDMSGNPVWFLPDIKNISVTPRDIKLSPQGTITLLTDQAYEINYNGDVIWSGPNDGTVSGNEQEGYHHEFTRLGNGNYMVLGSEFLFCNKQQDGSYLIDPFKDAKQEVKSADDKKELFGTIIEYDTHGNVVWSWKSSAYYRQSDLRYFIPHNIEKNLDLHENSFYFDEENGYIFVSFKNANRVIKIKYPDGNVISTWGETYAPGVPEKGNGLFCGQHACRWSQNGNLLLFNNNSCLAGIPRIEKIKAPASDGAPLKPVWEYEFPIEADAPIGYQSGGNVLELPDQSIFACMGGLYSKLFIVDTSKNIVWSALPERWNAARQKWIPASLYRASIIENRDKLEQLIWNAQPDDQIVSPPTRKDKSAPHPALPAKPAKRSSE